MRVNFRDHRFTFVAFSLALLAGAAALPLVGASCSAQRSKGDEAAAFEQLRSMTRGGALPSDADAARLAAEYAGTRTGALARVVRARLRLNANDFAGAAALLDSRDLAAHTSVGDYALWLRADALERAGRRVEARAAFEQLARDFPESLRAREAALRAATLTLDDNQPAAVPTALKKYADADDATALLLTAKAYERTGDTTRALAAYRRLYFYAPTSAEAEREAALALLRLGSSAAPASAEEAAARAERLLDAKRHADAVDAYADSFARFPATATPEAQLRRGVAAFNARRAPETVAALSAVPAGAGELRAEALHHLVQHYARVKQWPAARASADELRRAFPQSAWTLRALAAAVQTAKEAKHTADTLYFARAAVAAAPGAAEVAGAQFEIAWAAHDAKDLAEASRLLVEHLAQYADRNTDNRGKAGYWAARDSERTGRLAEARALYEAMLARYDANWYGHLARQRLDALSRNPAAPRRDFAPDSPVGRAVANLKPVTVAEESAGPAEERRLTRAEQLAAAGLDDLAHGELDEALKSATESPRLRLAKARLFRARGDNLQAFNVLRRSFPDYSQMKVEELSPDEWDVFYPLSNWETIVHESRAKNLDPYTVAGLIRQESVFNPRAASHANAYGLMQLLVPTARLTARSAGVERDITVETLFDPRINIQLGTTYLRRQLDKFGRIEYTAAAYNAGPGRAEAWRASLPLQIDEWVEAVPFRETRGYVQGVVRNTLQYRRLYDEQGRFRPEVGSRAVRSTGAPVTTPGQQVRPRRASGEEEEER